MSGERTTDFIVPMVRNFTQVKVENVVVFSV